MPEIIDPVFVKTSQNARFLLSENERFGLVFVKTGSINSGIGLCIRARDSDPGKYRMWTLVRLRNTGSLMPQAYCILPFYSYRTPFPIRYCCSGILSSSLYAVFLQLRLLSVLGPCIESKISPSPSSNLVLLSISLAIADFTAQNPQ